MNLEKLFNPKSIAVVGASSEEGKVGNVIAKNLLKLGYAGEVFLVNPKCDTLLDRKCYKNLNDIGSEIDLAVVAIPARFVNEEIKNNAERIKNYVVISAGFSETGEEGKKREEELARIAQENDLNILGPNCLGFIVPKLKLNASFAGGLPEAGRISFVSQSGALAVAFMDKAAKEGMKFSNLVSVGNKMQLTETEILEYLEKDADTKVIGMYLEGIKNGKSFLETVSRVAREKPVIILKAGKTEKAQEAISSHTGALAGSDEIISAVLKKAGVMRAENLEEFFDMLNLADNSKEMTGGNVAVVTNAGGPGVLTTDAFFEKEIKLAELDGEIKEKLRGFLPGESSVENPIDLLGDAREDRYEKTLAIIENDKNIDTVICVLTPQDQTPVSKIAEKIVEFKDKTVKNVTAVFIGGERIEEAVKKMRENGICNFSYPEQAVRALDNLYRWEMFKKRKSKIGENLINLKRREKAEGIINIARTEGRTALYFSEAKKLAEMYGINAAVCAEILPKDTEGKALPKIEYPAVLKVDSDQVLHKTDKKGIRLNIKNKKELEKAVAEMRLSFSGSRLVVQPMVEIQTELILGIKNDPMFGLVLVYGLGGIYTEVFKMVDFLVSPVSLAQAEESLLKGKLKFLFQETRGQKAYNLEEIAKILVGLGFLAGENPDIRELDINPLLVYNNGKSAVAVDVKVMV
ncbi:MAG: hypothetical protein QG620_60 [Patescibacteria group bacterium]|nr:hypothetical protein [Patescibacteria group bacterium]